MIGWLCPVCGRSNQPEDAWHVKGKSRETGVLVFGGCKHCYMKCKKCRGSGFILTLTNTELTIDGDDRAMSKVEYSTCNCKAGSMYA